MGNAGQHGASAGCIRVIGDGDNGAREKLGTCTQQGARLADGVRWCSAARASRASHMCASRHHAGAGAALTGHYLEIGRERRE